MTEPRDARATPKPRTVLLMTDEIDVGGKRSYVDILKAGLEQIGWRTELVNWASLSWPERAFAAGGYHVLNRFSRGLGHRWLLPLSTRFLRRRVRALMRGPNPPDIIHAQEPMTYFPARAEAAGKPVVMTIHGRFSLELVMISGHSPEHPNVQFLSDAEKRSYGEADLVVSVDRTLERYVRAYRPSGDVPVLTNFIDTRRFHPRVESRPFAADVERWIAGRPVVLCTRRLVPKNGVQVAVRAARLLADRGRDVAMLVAGDGPQRAELEALVKELDVANVFRFAGEIEHGELPGLYRRADVVIIPSVPSHGVEEGSSISALEGLAAGRPTIASRSGGLPEMIEDGKDGLLVPPDEPQALADAIESLIADPARAATLGDAAARRIERERSHVHGAERYARLYEEVLERTTAPGPAVR